MCVCILRCASDSASLAQFLYLPSSSRLVSLFVPVCLSVSRSCVLSYLDSKNAYSRELLTRSCNAQRATPRRRAGPGIVYCHVHISRGMVYMFMPGVVASGCPYGCFNGRRNSLAWEIICDDSFRQYNPHAGCHSSTTKFVG